MLFDPDLVIFIIIFFVLVRRGKSIFTVLALARLSARNARIETLAVFFLTLRLFANAPLVVFPRALALDLCLGLLDKLGVGFIIEAVGAAALFAADLA